jgi:lantibiotic modifying enzyme
LKVRAEVLPCLHRLLAAELADMDEHNIPIFVTRPSSRDLWSSRGRRIAKFFNCSGLDLVRNRLRGFGESDFARQTALIRRSFASLV